MRHERGAAPFVALLLLAATTATAKPSITKRLTEAHAKLRAEDFEGAIASYDEVIDGGGGRTVAAGGPERGP